MVTHEPRKCQVIISMSVMMKAPLMISGQFSLVWIVPVENRRQLSVVNTTLMLRPAI
jgi:hypothetical protein